MAPKYLSVSSPTPDLTSILNAVQTMQYNWNVFLKDQAAPGNTAVAAKGSVKPGTVYSIDGSGGTTGLTITGGPVVDTGTLTLGGSLAVSHGGTGATTDTGTGANVLSVGPAISGASISSSAYSGTVQASLCGINGGGASSAFPFVLTCGASGGAFINGFTGASFPAISMQPSSGVAFLYTLYFNASGGGIGSITGNSVNVAYNTSSDRRLKENIRSYEGGLKTVLRMHPVEFNFIGNVDTVVGFIAQEHYEVVPEAVTMGGNDPRISPWQIDYGRSLPVVVGGMQEIYKELVALREKVLTLESRIMELEDDSV